MQIFLNPAVRRDAAYRGGFTADEYADVAAFYAGAPATPLRPSPALARANRVAALLIKDESSRFGLEAFKIAGARYAMARLAPSLTPAGVVCATAGNHGRAVARAARESAVPCTVFVPQLAASATVIERTIRDARVAGMRADGAATNEVPGNYEAALASAARHAASTGATIVSDTSWPGEDAVPRLIMLGYTWIFRECSGQWSRPPDIVLVQGGVGGLLAAAANWFAWQLGPARPFLIGCEPGSHACLLESARAGSPIDLPTPRRGTMMAGLRCTRPSASAWPAIASGVDAFISITDARAAEAMEMLEHSDDGQRILAGPSGACGLGALLALVQDEMAAPLREACGLAPATRALVVVTERP